MESGESGSVNNTRHANCGYLSRILSGITLVSYIPVRARLRIGNVQGRRPFSPLRASFFVSHLTDGRGGRGRHGRERITSEGKKGKTRKESENRERGEYRVQDEWGDAQDQQEAGYRLAVELDDASVLEYVALILVLVHRRLVLFGPVWLVAVSPIVPSWAPVRRPWCTATPGQPGAHIDVRGSGTMN